MFDGRRGAQRKSSFDVCLNDFEWEKPNERERLAMKTRVRGM